MQAPDWVNHLPNKEMKNFMANNNNNLLIHVGLIDEKRERKIIPLAYYYDGSSDKIYLNTPKISRKVYNLRKKNIIAYCIDDPKPPFKGVRGKGVVKIQEDVSHNIRPSQEIYHEEHRNSGQSQRKMAFA